METRADMGSGRLSLSWELSFVAADDSEVAPGDTGPASGVCIGLLLMIGTEKKSPKAAIEKESLGGLTLEQSGKVSFDARVTFKLKN